ncbi:hypothetical protein ACWERV_23130 [Streptomyces sp. NPDC004031]
MKNTSARPWAYRFRRTCTGAAAWARARRRAALAQVLRGACYAVGSGAVGLAVVWLEHHAV